jgi:hypothetical protein
VRTLGALGDLRVRTEWGTSLSPELLLDPRPGGEEGDPEEPEDPIGRRRLSEDGDLDPEILLGSWSGDEDGVRALRLRLRRPGSSSSSIPSSDQSYGGDGHG